MIVSVHVYSLLFSPFIFVINALAINNITILTQVCICIHASNKIKWTLRGNHNKINNSKTFLFATNIVVATNGGECKQPQNISFLPQNSLTASQVCIWYVQRACQPLKYKFNWIVSQIQFILIHYRVQSHKVSLLK